MSIRELFKIKNDSYSESQLTPIKKMQNTCVINTDPNIYLASSAWKNAEIIPKKLIIIILMALIIIY